MNAQKTCFVVQGLGKKIDYHTGRQLNLDASYLVIKEAVTEAGLLCLRVDEFETSGLIDQPLYEWLFKADLVIADLSTSNLNAAYELGVRFGLRPRATIIVAETQFQSPFDIDLPILRYEHLGTDLGRREAERFKSLLKGAIDNALRGETIDSPVYLLESSMSPPVLGPEGSGTQPPGLSNASPREPRLDRRVNTLLRGAGELMKEGKFAEARTLLQSARDLRTDDESIVRQLALAVYRSGMPDPVVALNEARALLAPLEPATTNDPETLGLWGAVHKRLWETAQHRPDLDTAIAAYERGFHLAESYYSGINLAYLYDVRASIEAPTSDGEGIADAVVARRIRRAVMALGERALEAGLTTGRFSTLPDQHRPTATTSEEERIWIVATLLEAAVGIGDDDAAARWQAMLEDEPPAPWIRSTIEAQLANLKALLAKSPLRGTATA
jgi:tetratricopeptide (TPR) repeat protein